ncbi:MAG: glycosyltransferase [Xanthomonadaceae bacterium]|nr:glycosyltransferase [Rhodospirillaceae bacterium]NIA17628.1 glycosyltransferase [Xanthomonadaceae bacterium]
MNKLFFSIILPTYNRLYSLKKIFLPGLEKQGFLDYELIIIDDGSSDGTKEYFKNGEFKKTFKRCGGKLKYIKSDNNKGAPTSRNKGAALAKGEWLWIVEDDVQIDDVDFLEKSKNVICGIDNNIAVVSPKRREIIKTGYYKNPKNDFVRIGVLSGEIYLDPNQEYSRYVSNTHASSFIKKKIFNKFQEDEKLFYGNTYRDESDLYFRIVKSGYKIYYCGDVLKIIHRNDFARCGGQKKVAMQSLLKRKIMIFKNHYLYLNKNYNFPKIRILFFVLVRIVRFLGDIMRLKFINPLLAYIKL